MEDHGVDGAVDGAEKEVIRPENNAGDRSNHIRLHRPRHKGIVCVSPVHSSTNQSSGGSFVESCLETKGQQPRYRAR